MQKSFSWLYRDVLSTTLGRGGGRKWGQSKKGTKRQGRALRGDEEALGISRGRRKESNLGRKFGSMAASLGNNVKSRLIPGALEGGRESFSPGGEERGRSKFLR